ncbi:copper amine oxidase N-terminal domain-containing protein [Proteocatella sphenisci]|uniref:copper amine oxidase N-terminal domain-containing protein n=1 Tax=Proteocatella sphenisci TaxID=181070 RepID=UPI0004B66464|nr:copper amine oxidase N-terminal domain-containing protein [Proteocatella sphenisci]
MNKILSVFLAVFLTLGGSYVSYGETNSQNMQTFENINYNKTSYIRVFYNGNELEFDYRPQAINGRIMVPVSGIFKHLGINVSWDSATKTVNAWNNETNISFVIGSKTAMVDNQERYLDVPAMAINGKTMVPVRFLSESMGYNIVWVQGSNILLMSENTILEWRYSGYEQVAPYKEFETKYINGVKTQEVRYNGKNHDVKFYNLFSADGRVVPDVPEFNIPNYGTGWRTQSPFVGNTYWVDIDMLKGPYANSRLYDNNGLTVMSMRTLEESAHAGNYIKLKINDHFFDLSIWNSVDDSKDRALSTINNPELVKGRVIPSHDTLFKVTVNDRYDAVISLDSLISPILNINKEQSYAILQSDPKYMFNWDDDVWNRLKGEKPWIGMTGDMIAVQRLAKPSKVSKITTQLSEYELWVYEGQYIDSVYYFDKGILTAMW